MKVVSVQAAGLWSSQRALQAGPQLTIVGGPNESGKSTLHRPPAGALRSSDLPNRGGLPKDTESATALPTLAGWGFQGGGGDRAERTFLSVRSRPRSTRQQSRVRPGERRGRHRPVPARPSGRRVGRAGDEPRSLLAVSTVAQDQLLSLTGSALGRTCSGRSHLGQRRDREVGD